MYRDKRVVVVIPAGRKEYLSILVPQIRRDIWLVDELQLWYNTVSVEDDEYIRSLSDSFVQVVPHPLGRPTGNGGGIYPFFKVCQDLDTVYIRLDDDIVWIEPDGLIKWVDFRIDHPEFWLVSANVINNAVVSNIHQRIGAIPPEPVITRDCLDDNGWKSGVMAEKIHRIFLRNLDDLGIYRFPPEILEDDIRFSINAISWLGEDMARLKGAVEKHEENDLTVTKPRVLGKHCAIFSGCIVSHFAFNIQRPHVERTNLLGIYRSLP